MSSEASLKKLMILLEQNHIELEEISHLEAAVESTKKPLHKRAIDMLKNNWKRVRGEMHESKRLTRLLKQAQQHGKESLSEEEKQFIQAQLHDFFRIFPASIIAGVNAVLPIPGSGLFTPLILRKLGLLPSRWREAHILQSLQEAHKKLKATGNQDGVQLLEEVSKQLQHESKAREACDLLLIWDENQNGTWDEEELQAYQEELARTRILVTQHAHNKDWFFLYDGLVFGPNSLDQFALHTEDLLVCYKSETKWVSFKDIQSTINAED